MQSTSNRIYSYKDINELHNVNYYVRPFTNFEVSIFNFDINADNLIIEQIDDCDQLYSLCSFYEIYKNYKKVINITHRLLSFGDARGYLKLGVYLLDYKNDKEKSFEMFKIGAKKGNLICIHNVGIECIQNKQYEQAIIYLLEGIKQNKYYVCVRIFYCYAMLGDNSTAYKYLLLGIKNGDEESMNAFCSLLNENDLYYALLNLNFTNELIQNKMNELRPRIVNEEHITNITFHSKSSSELFNIDFDLLMSKQENETICNDLGLDGYKDIFEYLDDLLKNEEGKDEE